jgi:5-methylcytosine-specific restriction endonuclease McrA
LLTACAAGKRQIASAEIKYVERDGLVWQLRRATVGRDGMSDRRYSTARWQRLRKAVLARDGHQCMIGGPRCRGYATTVHHLVPSSQAPHLFWEPSNLVASCPRCNYGDGSRIAADNRRQQIAYLQQLVEEQQQQQIAQMAERLARYEDADSGELASAKRPAIY